MPTQSEIQATQGTRKSSVAPWESYESELTQKLSPRMAAQVADYATKHHQDAPTSEQTKELLAELYEGNAENSKQYQFLHPNEYKDEGPRLGKIMHSTEFLKKLRKECKLDCWYRAHPHRDKATLIVRRDGLEPEVACWVQLGFAPEYELVRFDRYGVVLDSKMRGWRTCTLQMILKGILTEELADKVFGKAEGPASGRYKGTLYSFRNRGKEWDA
jgi:hypothetical protein